MRYTGQVYRHPIESDTPLLEVTAGCSHNKCSFCTMYNETKFEISPMENVIEDIKELRKKSRNIERIFLINGEPFALPVKMLVEIGEAINKYIPEIKTITCYASIKGIKRKSLEDLKTLRKLNFNQLHIGLETAYDDALVVMNKGFTQKEAYESIEKLVEAGFEWDSILMLGVAGKGLGEVHIKQTAELLNKYPPYLVSLMTTSVPAGTPLEKLRDNNEFMECTELEKIEEEKLLLELIDFEDAYFFGGHYYNLIPINAPLSQKNEIIKYIDDELKYIDKNVLNTSYQRENI